MYEAYTYGDLAFAFALLTLGIGAFYDIRERRVPNILLLVAFSLVCFWAYEGGTLTRALVKFFIINAMGVYIHKNRMLAGGDVKYLSVVMMLLDTSNVMVSIIFIVSLLIIAGIVLHFNYPKRKNSIVSGMKKTAFRLKTLIGYRINIFPPEQMSQMTKEEKMTKTTPFTPVLFAGFLTTLLFTTCFG